MMVYLVAVYFSTCGIFSTDCVKADTVDRFVAVKQCRDAASAMRKVAKTRGQQIVYLCLDRNF